MRGRHSAAAASGALLAIVSLAGGGEAAGIGGGSGIGGGAGIGVGSGIGVGPSALGSSLSSPGTIGHHTFGVSTLVPPPAPVLDLRGLGTPTGGTIPPPAPLHAVGVTVTQNGPTTPAPFTTFDLGGRQTIRPGTSGGTSITSSSTASQRNQVTLNPTVLGGGNVPGTRVTVGFDPASLTGGGGAGTSGGGTMTIGGASGGTAGGAGGAVTIAG
ncbi:MAG TPA: hypothetical protein VGL20_19205 [Candidatus Dormibacteraeota bacterium]|jgi:hypothetical protein